MGNHQSTLEQSLPSLSFESLENIFNQSVTGYDQADKSTKLMTRSDFAKQFPQLSQQKLFGQQYFNLFDLEQVGIIDFSQFYGGLTVLLNAKIDTKLDAVFRLLDPAGNGKLEEYEVLGFVEKTLAMLREIDPTIAWDERISVPKTQQELTSTYGTVTKPTKTSTVNLFNEQPLHIGPIEVCLDSQHLVDIGFASLGKGVAPVFTNSPPSPQQSIASAAPTIATVSSIDSQLDLYTSNNPSTRLSTRSASGLESALTNRTLTKTEFVRFIRNVPQLLFVVVWAMNISFIQHICKQTRLEFIQQCETHLVSQFPLNDYDLLQQYQRLSSFFHEILFRRLSLINNIQRTSLLQQDLEVVKQYFIKSDFLSSTTSNEPPSMPGSGATTPTARGTSPFRPKSRTSFFSRSDSSSTLAPISTTAINEDGIVTYNSSNTMLLPKISPLTYPYTYYLPDTTIQQPILTSSLLHTVAAHGHGNQEISPNNHDISHDTSAPTPSNLTSYIAITDAELFNSITLSTCGTLSKTSNSPHGSIDLTKWSFFPDTIPFFLYFLQIFKLQHLIHRNRTASHTKCQGLLSNVKHAMNSEYIELITKQYLYEIQRQYAEGKKTPTTTADSQHNDASSTGDINARLMQILRERSKEKAANNGQDVAVKIGEKSPPGKKKTPSTIVEKKKAKQPLIIKKGKDIKKPISSDDDDDNDSDSDFNIDDLEQLHPNFGNNGDDDVMDELNDSNNETTEEEPEIPQTSPLSSPIQTTPIQQPIDFDNDNALVNPNAEHLMTEAMIPTFLSSVTKRIRSEYLPFARGPYAMICLELFIKEYIPDALGQLLAAYRHVVTKKITDKVLKDHSELLVDINDYINELLLFKTNFKEQLQTQQVTIHELEDIVSQYKSQHDDIRSEMLLLKEQNMILKTELTDVISVKDMAIITLRDELQFFTKESQHWSDHISRLEQQVKQLKQEKVQKDIEVAQLRAQKDNDCSIM